MVELSSPFLIIISLLIIAIYFISTQIHKNKKLPPGPWKLPIIGNLHQLVTTNTLQHHLLTQLAKTYGDLMHLQVGNTCFIIVSSSEIAKQVIKTNDLTFADRHQVLVARLTSNRVGRSMLVAPFGNYSQKIRHALITKFLSNEKVRSFSSTREDEVYNMVNNINIDASSSQYPVNLSRTIFSFVTKMLFRTAFSRECDMERFESTLLSINELILLSISPRLGDLFSSLEFVHVVSGLRARILKVYEEIHKLVDDIISEHMEVEREMEDLVDALLHLQNSGGGVDDDSVSSNDVKAVILETFVVGVVATASTTISAMAEMIKNPRVMKKAQDELRQVLGSQSRITDKDIKSIKYLKLVLKETLRLHPASPISLPKVCRKDCEINGYKIPTGALVLVNFMMMGKDPKYWKDAESFIPERFEDSSIDFRGNHFEYIPFGAGKRMCPGISSAIANMELCLAALLYHFDWKLPDGVQPEMLDLSENYNFLAELKNDLCLLGTRYLH